MPLAHCYIYHSHIDTSATKKKPSDEELIINTYIYVLHNHPTTMMYLTFPHTHLNSKTSFLAKKQKQVCCKRDIITQTVPGPLSLTRFSHLMRESGHSVFLHPSSIPCIF